MTQAKAATVVSALVTAGYTPQVSIDGSGSWRVSVQAADGVTAQTIQTFATNNAVGTDVHQVDFI